MSLKEKINSDLKEAMRSGNKVRLATIRSLRALILEFEKSGKDKELTPEDEINLLSGAAKKRKDSICCPSFSFGYVFNSRFHSFVFRLTIWL